MPDNMRPATPEVQCGDEAVHGEHEWMLLGAFRSQCPGHVGAAVVEPEVVRVSLDDLTGHALFSIGDLRWAAEQPEGSDR